MTTAGMSDLLALARTVASDAAALAAGMRKVSVELATTKSSVLDIVTKADFAVEALIRDRLLSARPSDGFIGEEGEDIDGVSGITWVVDPIDGTVNYLYGSPYYAVSIAAVTSDALGSLTVLAGVINAPALAVEYTASAGRGAQRNGKRLTANRDVDLDSALVSTAFPYDIGRRSRVLEDVTKLVPRVRDLRLVGAATLEICGVAEGRTDAHLHRGLHLWDYAAATLIARESGADVLGFGGRPGTDDLLLVSAPGLADRVRVALQE